MRLQIFSIAIVSILFFGKSEADDAIPVLLRVNGARQPDSLGYNFTTRLSTVVYNEIVNGHARLWDSREMEIQLSPASLKEIESSTNTDFKSLNQIFIYENWQSTPSEIITNTLGFLFFTKNQKDEDVLFGYVEYNDVASALLSNYTLANANGTCSMTMAYALNAHYFDFDLVQFGAQVYKSHEESLIHETEFIGLRDFNTSMFPQPASQKRITYLIEKSVSLTDEKAKLSDQLLKNIEAVLKTSDLFQKIGGYRMQNIQLTDITISRMLVEEVWTIKKGIKYVSPQWLVIYLNDAALDTLKGLEIDRIDMRIYNESMSVILQNKKFNYIITKINEQTIQRSQAFMYQKALEESPWNELNEFVEKY